MSQGIGNQFGGQFNCGSFAFESHVEHALLAVEALDAFSILEIQVANGRNDQLAGGVFHRYRRPGG
ncbi:hypothetical protein D3C81_2254970 [compost metagenome]